MGLMDRIGEGIIAFDTNCLIYYIERHGQFSPIVKPLFQAIEGGTLFGVTSTVTLTEVLTLPLKKGLSELVNHYYDILTDSENIEMIPVDEGIAKHAAELRARYEGLRTPDAFQIATGMFRSARAFICNDTRLKSIEEIPVVILKDYL